MAYTLITGGVRSGKSRIAEQLAGEERRVLYVATGTVSDGEMAKRVRIHQERRPEKWGLLEVEGESLTEALRREMERARCGNKSVPDCGSEQDYKSVPDCGSVQGYKSVLIDCLSTWVSSILLNLPESEWRSESTRQRVLTEAEQLAHWLQEAPWESVVVTSETGLGGVAMSPLGRAFQDLLGEVNQIVAQRAREVYMAVSGLALRLTDV